eukprot:TRINITY_DN2836_c0_g1_i1.p1 TRINITY_DN2836_c0_g1~~TRINITY_DN2836_c0_g1_i1.p1  ORF type:complete len:250 (+),score=116.63 TRINITY_DN2836_c0_g1_i1:28-750(+)
MMMLLKRALRRQGGSTGGSMARRWLSSQAGSGASQRVFASMNVFKQNASFSVRFRPPTLRPGKYNNSYLQLARPGGVVFEFAPSLAGSRGYDWQQKEYFSISPAEIGELLCLKGDEMAEFSHDPNVNTPDMAGQVVKTLTIRPGKNETRSFDVTVTNAKEDSRVDISVPLTRGEFKVLKSLLNNSLPHMYAWGLVVDPIYEDAQPHHGGAAGAGGAGGASGGAGGGSDGFWSDPSSSGSL